MPRCPRTLRNLWPAGEPPVVFTLGSAAVLAAGDFYEVSAKAALKLGIRAVLLIGMDPRNRLRQSLPDTICVAEYAPYSALFSRSSLVVHQGGVGTTAQCLRAGKPMLIMPYSHDQPDNARRMRRLKVAKEIQKASYKPARVARKLKAMLGEPRFCRARQECGTTARTGRRRKDGVRRARGSLPAHPQITSRCGQLRIAISACAPTVNRAPQNSSINHAGFPRAENLHPTICMNRKPWLLVLVFCAGLMLPAPPVRRAAECCQLCPTARRRKCP